MSKTAVILAGGKGTRLRPYTTVLPKPLMPIGDYPILEVVVRQLAASGITRIIMAVNHQAEIIKSFFNSGSKWNISIEYSLEKQPLGTMGPLRLMEDLLPDNFMVLNGDILTDLDFSGFHKHHQQSDSMFTIAAYKRSVRSEFGVLKVDSSNSLVGFEEKPEHQYQVSMGAYMVSKSVINHIAENSLFGFDDLMHTLLAARKKVGIYHHDGLWLDIGRPDDYMQAIDLFEKQKSRFLGNGTK
ncbi:nucleotidyltransferase family protein [Salidesulfovibrio onnuriiensis]|uniref:nucleotidyltransferase family protein n=1 Tax=Salidesulfovibrio onnuriiensis TaxID=2583823 RepID=UPI0011C75459|nr:nucleotidyltransferase family protein [Salidesulfovibrio onnuriiensis]